MYAILRVDGNIRGNAGTGIDEKVKIRKSEAEYAKKIVIQPTQPIRLVGGEQYLARVLRGRSVIEGQTVRVDVIGNAITLVIAKVVPKGIAIVTDETEIELEGRALQARGRARRRSPISITRISAGSAANSSSSGR